MSLSAMIWALEQAPVDNPTGALVLTGLANHAAGDGTAAWPSQRTLAVYARCDERTVRRHLAALEEAGLIRRGDQELLSHLPAHSRPVVYDLDLTLRRPVTTTPGQIVRGSNRAAPPDKLSPPPGQDVPPQGTPVSPPPGHTIPPQGTLVSDKQSLEPVLEQSDEAEEPAAALLRHFADTVTARTKHLHATGDADRVAMRDVLAAGTRPETVRSAIDFAAADPFWATRITTARTLCAKLPVLLAQLTKAATAPSPRPSTAELGPPPYPGGLDRAQEREWARVFLRVRAGDPTRQGEAVAAADQELGVPPRDQTRPVPMPAELRRQVRMHTGAAAGPIQLATDDHRNNEA